MNEQASQPGKASSGLSVKGAGVRMSVPSHPETQGKWHGRRQRRETAFSGGRIKMIYLLAPHYPLLASLGLSLVPLIGSSRPPRSQAWPHTQSTWYV